MSTVKNETCDRQVYVAPEVHAVELTAWDVPPTVVAGERFVISVGAKCASGCDLSGRELSLFDQKGARTGALKLGQHVCPGTEALHFARVEVSAPLDAGSHPWEAKIAGWKAEVTHAPGSFPLTVRVVPAPDCEVAVRAVDRETQTPITGARVVVHPYRAVTDANGMAKIRVARGAYDILVSGLKYAPICISVEVAADMVTIAQLDAEQPSTSTDEDLT